MLIVSKEHSRQVGDLMLIAAELPKDSVKELVEQARLYAGPQGPAWRAFNQRTRRAGLPDQPKPSLLTVIATTQQGEIAETKTRTRFTGYAYRSDRFDNLPATQPSTGSCEISTLAPTKGWTFAEAARALPGVEQTSDIAALGRSLIANGYTMTLAQAEDMVERTKRGEATRMRTDGYGNFFFVETGDENNPVSVGHVYRHGASRWVADLGDLAYDGRWGADFRLLVRNLDALKL